MAKLKSLKWSCVMSVVSAFLGWLSISFAFWNITACVDCIMWLSIIFWILSLFFVVIWFVSLFFVIKNLTNSNIWWTLSVLVMVVLVWASFMLRCLLYRGNVYLLGMYNRSLYLMFWVLFIVSIMLCVITWIRRHKEAKKSS